MGVPSDGRAARSPGPFRFSLLVLARRWRRETPPAVVRCASWASTALSAGLERLVPPLGRLRTRGGRVTPFVLAVVLLVTLNFVLAALQSP